MNDSDRRILNREQRRRELRAATMAPKLADALRMAFDAHSYPPGQRPAWYVAAIEALAEWEAQ